MNSLLLINQSSPYQGQTAQESLDLAMASANFGQHVTLLFVDDGVFQLLKNQQPENIEVKNFSKSFAALEFYDVDNIYVCMDSMKKRGLEMSQLCIEAESLNSAEIQQLLSNNAICLRF